MRVGLRRANYLVGARPPECNAGLLFERYASTLPFTCGRKGRVARMADSTVREGLWPAKTGGSTYWTGCQVIRYSMALRILGALDLDAAGAQRSYDAIRRLLRDHQQGDVLEWCHQKRRRGHELLG